MLEIVIAPNPVLSDIAKPVVKVNSGVQEMVEEMKKTLAHTTDPKGVGLAAPQIGKSIRIFIAKPTDKSNIQVFINPKVINKGVAPEEGLPTARTEPAEGALAGGRLATGPRPEKSKGSTKLEGCLSLPTIWGPVLRNSSVTVSYLDEHGKSHRKKFSGFMSTIVQHEMDHLNGILFPKRVLEQKGILYKSQKNEKGEDVFEEIEI